VDPADPGPEISAVVPWPVAVASAPSPILYFHTLDLFCPLGLGLSRMRRYWQKRAERQFRHFAYQPDLTKGQRRKQISFWGHTGKLKKGHTRKMYFFQSHTGKKLYTICYLFILIFRNLILDILATK
jgi:hypothetical protein